MNWIREMLAEDNGKLSGPRAMLIFATTTVVIQWNVLSFRAGVLLPIDYSIVTFITALGINKAVQKFAESKAPPPVDTLKTETTTKTSETTNTPVQP